MIAGEAALYSGEYERALRHYFAAMDLRPKHMAPALGALRCLRLHGHAEARTNVSRTVQAKIKRLSADPKTLGAAYLLAARHAIALGKTGEAIDKASVAVRELPDMGVAWRIFGDAAMVSEQWGRAVHAFRKAADLGLKAKAGTWERLADALDELGDLPGAERAARKSLAMTGSDPNAKRRRLSLLAVILKHGGQLEEALQTIKEALKLGPRDPAAIHNHATILEAVGKPKEAVKRYQEVLTITASPTSSWRLAHAFLKLDKHEEALKALLFSAANMDRWSWPASTRWWVSFDIGKLFVKARLVKRALDWFGDALVEARDADAARKIRGWITLLASQQKRK